MKKYRLKTLLLFMTIMSIVGLSSCDVDDYYWRETRFDFSESVLVDRRTGYFDEIVRILDTDIQGYNPAREDLVAINPLRSWFIMSNIVREDRIDNLRIEAAGRTYDFRGIISGNLDNEFTVDEPAYNAFMTDALRELDYRGYLDIRISGRSNIYDGGPIVFNFFNNLDIQLRE